MNEWPSGKPSAETIRWAEERLAELDASPPPGGIGTLVGADAIASRVEGFVAEAWVAEWLDRIDVPYRWDGGANGNPDFVVAGVPVAVRITAVRSSVITRRSLVYTFAFHVHEHAPRERCFVGVDRSTGIYYLLGGIELDRFVDAARFVRQGETVCAGFVALRDMYVAEVGVLTAPAEWISRISGEVAA